MKLKYLTLIIFCLSTLVSCNTENNDLNIDTIEYEKITFSFDILGTNPQTRLFTGSNFKSVFTNGDKIGVYIVENGQSLLSSGNWADNVCVTYNGTNWTNNLTGDKQYYPNDGTTFDFYAYYPYDAGMSDPTNYTFKIQADQSLDADFQRSDFLMSQKSGVSKSKNAVKLTFKHALSLVHVKTVNDAVENLDVTMNNFYSSIKIDLKNQACTTLTTDAPINIQMLKTSGQSFYRALVPPQDWNQTDTNLLWIKNGNDLYTYSHSENISLTSGNAWIININGIPAN